MSQVQIITTPNGERMAILPEAEYMRLIADTDSADIDAARQARDAGDYVPAAVVNRLVGGENPLRVWREHRGMTAKALAEAAGVSQPYMSELEGGHKQPSVDVLKRLAAALDVDLDDLV